MSNKDIFYSTGKYSHYFVITLFFLNKFIYLFLAVLGLRCCMQVLPRCSRWGLLFVWCTGLSPRRPLLLQSTASRHACFRSCGLQAPERRLSSCGTWAQLLRGMWDPPGPGLEPASPALSGGFPTTEPPGKSL